MRTLRNAAILTALGITAAAIVVMPMESNEATTVPGVVVTPQTTTSASPSEAPTGRAAPSASPSDTAAPGPSEKTGKDTNNDDEAAAERAPQAPAPAPADPAPDERPAAPAPPPAPVPVPQAPALSGVCEWDDDEWECDDDWGDD